MERRASYETQWSVLRRIWDDVDSDAGQLTVRARLDRQRQRVEPKTKRAVRVIELPTGITTALDAHRLSRRPFLSRRTSSSAAIAASRGTTATSLGAS